MTVHTNYQQLGLAVLASAERALTVFTRPEVAAVLAGVAFTVMSEEVGRDGAMRFLRELAASYERGDDISLEKPN